MRARKKKTLQKGFALFVLFIQLRLSDHELSPCVISASFSLPYKALIWQNYRLVHSTIFAHQTVTTKAADQEVSSPLHLTSALAGLRLVRPSSYKQQYKTLPGKSGHLETQGCCAVPTAWAKWAGWKERAHPEWLSLKYGGSSLYPFLPLRSFQGQGIPSPVIYQLLGNWYFPLSGAFLTETLFQPRWPEAPNTQYNHGPSNTPTTPSPRESIILVPQF